MVKFDGEQDVKILPLADVKEYAIPIIGFLESKIQWENEEEGDDSDIVPDVLAEPRKADSKVICMKCF